MYNQLIDSMNGAKMSSVSIVFSDKLQKFVAQMNGKPVQYRETREQLLKWITKKGFKVSGAVEAQQKVLPKTESAKLFSVADRFEFIEKFVGMIARKTIPSMIVTGNGGIGKTWTVTHTLDRLGKVEMGYGISSNVHYHYLMIKGYTTAKALYRTLFEHNGKIIVMDDCDSSFKDPIAANILKGALDSSEKRVISWGAEIRGEDDLPSSFEFTGQMIFISNLPIHKFPQALISRSVKVDLTLDTQEVVDRVETLLNETGEYVEDVIQFIRDHAEQFTDLNVRSAMTIKKIRDDIGDGWEKLALYQAMA